jgi:hypothetical protein
MKHIDRHTLLWSDVSYTRQSLTTPWGNLKMQGARIARIRAVYFYTREKKPLKN